MPLHFAKSADATKSWNDVIYQQLLIQSWWLWLFMIGTSTIYYSSYLEKKQEKIVLQQQLQQLQKQKIDVATLQQELCQQINSQNDPSWIELTLMKELGLIPEGYTKVYFSPTTLTMPNK